MYLTSILEVLWCQLTPFNRRQIDIKLKKILTFLSQIRHQSNLNWKCKKYIFFSRFHSDPFDLHTGGWMVSIDFNHYPHCFSFVQLPSLLFFISSIAFVIVSFSAILSFLFHFLQGSHFCFIFAIVQKIPGDGRDRTQASWVAGKDDSH